MSSPERLARQGLQQLRQIPGLSLSRPHRQRAAFWRGGTSNGIMIVGRDLPEWQLIRSKYPHAERLDLVNCANLLRPLYQAVMGSPDPYGRQLNGMGGGLSSLSKAVIVDTSTTDTADLDYLFVQVGIKDGELDLAGNCGNMSSAVAPFALEEGLLDAQKLNVQEVVRLKTAGTNRTITQSTVRLRLRNLNTNRIILADFRVSSTSSHESLSYDEQGEYVMDGVAGFGSPIVMSFTSPGGAKTGKALPTGNAIDNIELPGGGYIEATLSDISNPGVFIDGREVGWNPDRTPEELNNQIEIMDCLNHIRRAGASMMGLDPDTPSIPKVVMLFPPTSDSVDIACQALSMQQAHKAAPMTLALNLGVICKMTGTVAHKLAQPRDKQKTSVGHPSGIIEVGAEFSSSGEILSAQVMRTARCLMRGEVNTTPNEELSR